MPLSLNTRSIGSLDMTDLLKNALKVTQ